MTYRLPTTSPRRDGKNAKMNIEYTGIFALHDIKGISIIVMRRSFSFSKVRVAIIAGTEQPKPIIIGTKDLPESPMEWSARSIINAARDI